MNFPQSRLRLRKIATPLLASILLLPFAGAEEWVRISSKEGNVSALFPEDIRKDKQSQVERTIAGRVTTYFGEYHGDGIILAGSVADLPKLALKRQKTVFETTRKGFLKEAGGTEISFKSTTVDGASARELIYKGSAYRGKGDSYTGRALIFIVDGRLYIANAVISDATPANEAARKKMLSSIKVAK